MAEEENLFSFEDVVEAITAKMIRRHPHVFERSDADTPDKVKAQWAEIKAAEKAERAARRAGSGLPETETPGQLNGVPRALPALMEALKLAGQAASRSASTGARPGRCSTRSKRRSPSCARRSPVAADEKAADELGDVIFAVANLARHLKTDPEHALRSTNTKFRTRFAHVEAGLAKRGKTPGRGDARGDGSALAGSKVFKLNIA
jgi:ATP diphosphatase